MKINKIEFENFRNFKDHGEINCSTDGKVTVIYGKNGDGKTTLHQLFQWVFYGNLKFNKTATSQLYNWEYESALEFGDIFTVMGKIDFSNEGTEYSLTRTATYKKGLTNSAKIAEELTLLQMDSDYNWKTVNRPADAIEQMLPSGLSEYFFFDGESMIADLKVKEIDSARNLRKALFSIFDLNIIEAAINHIGDENKKTTVLGKLYLKKGSVASGSEISNCKTNIENALERIDTLEEQRNSYNNEMDKCQKQICDISEEIGSTKSKTDYEKERKLLKQQRDTFLENAKSVTADFGDAVIDMFPALLISKAVADAKHKIKLKITEEKLPRGVNKILLKYLLTDSTTQCICGKPLDHEAISCLEHYYDLLPPRSYTSLYNEFSLQAENLGKGYNRSQIEEYIKRALDNEEKAWSCDSTIKELDTMESKSKDIQELIINRQEAENRISELKNLISDIDGELTKRNVLLKKRRKEFDEITNESREGQIALHKISIMKEVLQQFEVILKNSSTTYSEKLQKNIQHLLDQMLTSKRTVSVSEEFGVRVTDSYNDESKSEGQFAVVSFAYIGGILKLLQDEEKLSHKEFPLILDGPFSKLDPEQRQNVVDTIPEFAPQVILFSKDDLSDVIREEKVGRIWTIQSNAEKNVAVVKEGHLW